MKKLRMVWIVFCMFMTAFVFTACESMQYYTPARERRRRHAVETDLYHLADDIDWMLGLDRPSRLYDQTLR